MKVRRNEIKYTIEEVNFKVLNKSLALIFREDQTTVERNTRAFARRLSMVLRNPARITDTIRSRMSFAVSPGEQRNKGPLSSL